MRAHPWLPLPPLRLHLVPRQPELVAEVGLDQPVATHDTNSGDLALRGELDNPEGYAARVLPRPTASPSMTRKEQRLRGVRRSSWR